MKELFEVIAKAQIDGLKISQEIEKGFKQMTCGHDWEIMSNCCGAKIYDDIGICSDCKEHCGEHKVCTKCEKEEEEWET